MNKLVRIARKEDAPHFIEIKKQLSISYVEGTSTQGGFLLGTDLETYEAYIDLGYCLVAEVEGEVVGFGIVFHDALLRHSDLWKRRDEVNWLIDMNPYETAPIAYFEQLAFKQKHSKLAIELAFVLAKTAFDDGHVALFTTTVTAPIRNLAAIPLIEAVGGIVAGHISEFYESIGPMESDIHCMTAEAFQNKVSHLPVYQMLSGKHFPK